MTVMVSPSIGFAEDSDILEGVPQSPEDFPDGWDDCMKERVKIAYVLSLPWYQRLPLEPYRLVKKWQYTRCMKSLLPETEAYIQDTYPIPFDPYKMIESDPSKQTDPSLKPEKSEEPYSGALKQ